MIFRITPLTPGTDYLLLSNKPLQSIQLKITIYYYLSWLYGSAGLTLGFLMLLSHTEAQAEGSVEPECHMASS